MANEDLIAGLEALSGSNRRTQEVGLRLLLAERARREAKRDRLDDVRSRALLNLSDRPALESELSTIRGAGTSEDLISGIEGAFRGVAGREAAQEGVRARLPDIGARVTAGLDPSEAIAAFQSQITSGRLTPQQVAESQRELERSVLSGRTGQEVAQVKQRRSEAAARRKADQEVLQEYRKEIARAAAEQGAPLQAALNNPAILRLGMNEMSEAERAQITKSLNAAERLRKRFKESGFDPGNGGHVNALESALVGAPSSRVVLVPRVSEEGFFSDSYNVELVDPQTFLAEYQQIRRGAKQGVEAMQQLNELYIRLAQTGGSPGVRAAVGMLRGVAESGEPLGPPAPSAAQRQEQLKSQLGVRQPFAARRKEELRELREGASLTHSQLREALLGLGGLLVGAEKR